MAIGDFCDYQFDVYSAVYAEIDKRKKSVNLKVMGHVDPSHDYKTACGLRSRVLCRPGYMDRIVEVTPTFLWIVQYKRGQREVEEKLIKSKTRTDNPRHSLAIDRSSRQTPCQHTNKDQRLAHSRMKSCTLPMSGSDYLCRQSLEDHPRTSRELFQPDGSDERYHFIHKRSTSRMSDLAIVPVAPQSWCAE
jgi:hypothetical protein